MERGYCIPTVRTLHCCNVHFLNSEWDCIPLYPLHQNEGGIGKSIPMGGCVTKRQRRVEYEVMYVKHQLVNLHLRWGTSRTKQKGLRSNWGACRFNTGPVCSCQSLSLCFLLIIKGHRPKRPWSGSLFWESFYCVKVTVSIAAGLHDQLRDLQESVRKMQVGLHHFHFQWSD